MSISTLQERFFNKGCFTAGIVVISLAMVASMFTRGGGASSRDESGTGSRAAVVTVGDVPVPAELFQAKAGELQAQAMQAQAAQSKVSIESLGAPDAPTQAMGLVRATGVVLQQAAVQALIANPPVTESEVAAFATASIEQSLAAAREDLVKQGKLKPNATDAEFEKAFKEGLGGKTLAQVRASAPADLVAAFKDPARKAAVLERFGGPILVQRLGAKLAGSDEALRDSYKSYVVRRIFLSAASGSKETPEARAAKAQADLKAGKSFEAEMDAMSNDPAPPGKKVHETTETVTADAFAGRPELASLKGKAANATTPVVEVPGGKAIYQLVSIKDDLPKEFEKDKAKLRAQRIQTLGTAEAEKQIKALVASDAVKWRSPGYRALSAVAEAIPMGFAMDPAATKKATDAALVALKTENPTDRRLATQALLVITDPKTALGMKTPETTANRKTALEAARANGIEDPTLLLELAGLYGDAKDGAKAAETLIAASKANSDYGVRGQRTFGDIAGKALDLQKKNVLTNDQLASIQAQQGVWSAARVENEKLAAEAKASAAKEQAANEAELARQKAEAAKTGSAKVDADAAKKANETEIARQKAEAAGGKKAPTGGSLLPTTNGGGQ